MKYYIMHHGVKGMHWGIQLGPPYPLGETERAVSDFVKGLRSIKYKDFSTLQSPETVKKTKSGSCHDQTLYEIKESRKIGLNPKMFFFMETNGKRGGTTHSFASFELNDKTYWLENSWFGQEGLHGYSDQDHMIRDIKKKWGKNEKYPELDYGQINPDKLYTGMTLQQIVDAVEFAQFTKELKL